MKTRQGFVSNSSSSSFCILGVEIDSKTEGIIEKNRSDALKSAGVVVMNSISRDDGVFVGIDVTTMNDDETPRQLKRRLVDSLHTIGVDIDIHKVGFIEDGGYNG
jgi:hypothetical protein